MWKNEEEVHEAPKSVRGSGSGSMGWDGMGGREVEKGGQKSTALVNKNRSKIGTARKPAIMRWHRDVDRYTSSL